MNQKKIEEAYKKIAEIMKEDSLKDKEFLVLLANLLINFGRQGISGDSTFAGVNITDAAIVELALNQNPNNPYLAGILQGHALLRWSDNLEG